MFKNIADQLIKISERRSPDFIIGGMDSPYMLRWYLLPRNRFLNVYLHHIVRDDDDRALHDHPWVSCSIILRGSYIELLPGDEHRVRTIGDITFRSATAAHRLALFHREDPDFHRFAAIGISTSKFQLVPCWTLFITGPQISIIEGTP